MKRLAWWRFPLLLQCLWSLSNRPESRPSTNTRHRQIERRRQSQRSSESEEAQSGAWKANGRMDGAGRDKEGNRPRQRRKKNTSRIQGGGDYDQCSDGGYLNQQTAVTYDGNCNGNQASRRPERRTDLLGYARVQNIGKEGIQRKYEYEKQGIAMEQGQGPLDHYSDCRGDQEKAQDTQDDMLKAEGLHDRQGSNRRGDGHHCGETAGIKERLMQRGQRIEKALVAIDPGAENIVNPVCAKDALDAADMPQRNRETCDERHIQGDAVQQGGTSEWPATAEVSGRKVKCAKHIKENRKLAQRIGSGPPTGDLVAEVKPGARRRQADEYLGGEKQEGMRCPSSAAEDDANPTTSARRGRPLRRRRKTTFAVGEE